MKTVKVLRELCARRMIRTWTDGRSGSILRRNVVTTTAETTVEAAEETGTGMAAGGREACATLIKEGIATAAIRAVSAMRQMEETVTSPVNAVPSESVSPFKKVIAFAATAAAFVMRTSQMIEGRNETARTAIATMRTMAETHSKRLGVKMRTTKTGLVIKRVKAAMATTNRHEVTESAYFLSMFL